MAAAPETQLLLLGDSITESLRGECARPECVAELPAVWASDFAPHKALALGVSGDRTENLLWRLANGETEGLHPAVTVVEIGTNNLAFGHSAEATAYGVQAVVRWGHVRACVWAARVRADAAPRVSCRCARCARRCRRRAWRSCCSSRAARTRAT